MIAAGGFPLLAGCAPAQRVSSGAPADFAALAASTCNDGLLIDLADLNSIRLGEEGLYAVTGPGVTAGMLDRAMAAQDRLLALGCNAQVGVAGLAPDALDVEVAVMAPARPRGTFTYHFATWWGSAKSAPARMAWVDGAVAALRKHETAAYVNYLSTDDPASVRRSYGANYARLQAIKRRYDPENVFHRNRNIKV